MLPLPPCSPVRRGSIAAVIMALCLAATASAQEIKATPLLKSGDEFTLGVTRVRESSSRPAQNGKSATLIDVRVISATEAGFILEWAQRQSAVDSARSGDPLMLAAADALRDLRLQLALNADGEYTRLVNQDEVVPRVQKALDPIITALLDKLPADQRPGAQKLMGQVLSPTILLGSLVNEARTYFGLSGVSLAVGETATAAVEQPNPFGGGSLAATFRVTMESATSESAVLRTETVYDAAAIVRAMRALMEQAGRPIPEPDPAAPPPVKLSDDGRFVLDRTLGLMRELVVNRRVVAENEQRLDRWEIRLVRAPQR
jgi:hypothetical protein